MTSPITPKNAPRITDERDRALYVISVAAELACVHPQTLRMYERKGLVTPKRTSGNNRRYSARDIDQIRLIQRMTQDRGMNLAAVRAVIALQRELDDTRDRLRYLEQEMESARQELHTYAQRVTRAEVVLSRDIRNLFEGDE